MFVHSLMVMIHDVRSGDDVMNGFCILGGPPKLKAFLTGLRRILAFLSVKVSFANGGISWGILKPLKLKAANLNRYSLD